MGRGVAGGVPGRGDGTGWVGDVAGGDVVWWGVGGIAGVEVKGVVGRSVAGSDGVEGPECQGWGT